MPTRRHSHPCRDRGPGDRRQAPFGRCACGDHNSNERLLNRLEQHRRIATRHEMRAAHYSAVRALGAVLLWR